MEKQAKAIFKTASPYQKDAMNLPVKSVEAAIPFYETVMGFQVISKQNLPIPSVILGRDEIQIGLAENGGDPEQEGCFFEVDNAETAFAELRANGLDRDDPGFRIDQYGEVKYKVFFVIAPDGLVLLFGGTAELGEKHVCNRMEKSCLRNLVAIMAVTPGNPLVPHPFCGSSSWFIIDCFSDLAGNFVAMLEEKTCPLDVVSCPLNFCDLLSVAGTRL